jgi:hypothetical protein
MQASPHHQFQFAVSMVEEYSKPRPVPPSLKALPE